jgi:hypothetical protein
MMANPSLPVPFHSSQHLRVYPAFFPREESHCLILPEDEHHAKLSEGMHT